MSAATGVRWRPLVAITTVVLCAHGLALRGVPVRLQWARPVLPVPVSVREVPAPQFRHASGDSAAPETSRPVHVRAPDAARPMRVPVADPVAQRGNAVPTPASSAPGHSAPVAIPESATWRYVASGRWRGMPVEGEAQLAWQHDDAAYEASFAIDVPPQRRLQNSTGALGEDGLRPLRFSQRVRGEEAAHFDRAQGRITFSSNRPDAALQAGAQDRLSVLVQLVALVAADPGRFVPGASMSLQVAGTRGADDWQFTVDGDEQLALPAGSVSALKLTRQPEGDYDIRLEVWLAPGRAYAPVRLRLTPPNADWLDMQWSGTDKR
jgi:hypothetical protein